ncbi:MAG: hypothetical protein K6T16_00470 [Candidatus Pacearchaeota archaeon]|nr:hypothetical protein [Candidatus Pacearchaeota archaeon]
MEIKNVVKAIIAVVVIVIVILFLLGFFNPLYEMLRGEMDLTTQETQMNKDNYDAFTTNIAACFSQQDNECACEGFPQFPGTFATNTQIQITELPNRKAEINLTHKKKSYRSQVFEGLKISAIHYDTKIEVPYMTTKTIDFAKEPPLYKQKDSRKKRLFGGEDMKVVSPMLYKKNDGIYFIIGYEQPKLLQLRKCGGGQAT